MDCNALGYHRPRLCGPKLRINHNVEYERQPTMTDPSAVTYRSARRGDADSIIAFQLSMAKETEDIELHPPTVTSGVRSVFDRPELGRYFVAEQSGHLVASLMITNEWSDWRNQTVWWIQSVFVTPDSRKQGIYAGLYLYVKSLCESDSSLAGIRLYVDRRNDSAQQVYLRLGMNGDHYQLFEWMKKF